jgi:hypothetical protein
MKRFLKNIVRFGLMYLLLLLIVGGIIEYVIYRNTLNRQYLLQADWDSKVNENYDALFIGNSRLWVQMDLKLLNSETSTKNYALSQDGSKIDLLWYKFHNYLKNNNLPKSIYLQFDPYFLTYLNAGTFYGKENYLSYIFFDRLGIDSLFNGLDGFNKLETFIPLIRYYGYPTEFKEHVLGRMLKRDKMWRDSSRFNYGTSPQQWYWSNFNKGTKKWENPEYTYKPMDFSFVDSFRIYCSDHNIKLILYYPPQTWRSYNRVALNLKNQLVKYASKYDLVFYNFNNSNYDDTSLFYNHMHLNAKGASKFTNEMMQCYKKHKY